MKSDDKPIKYLMTNSMTINLNVFGAFMKIKIVGKKDCSLVITIHGHGTLIRVKTWLLNAQIYVSNKFMLNFSKSDF